MTIARIQIVIDQLIHKRTHQECEQINTLRMGIQALPNLPLANTYTSDAEKQWGEFRRALRQSILNKDPRYFLRWPIILHTMFYRGNTHELEELRQSPLWKRWNDGITESMAGFPIRYPTIRKSSGNLIHHAHMLLQLENTYGVQIETINSIFEFGGGYGSVARLVYQLGFTGSYTIFDLPEFSLLQKYFLASINQTNTNDKRLSNIKLISDLSSFEKYASGPDLFLAGWSLSESPIEIREKILASISQPRYYLIAYQNTFQEINNKLYFKTFVAQRAKEYEWKSIPIDHLPGNTYLIGKRRYAHS